MRYPISIASRRARVQYLEGVMRASDTPQWLRENYRAQVDAIRAELAEREGKVDQALAELQGAWL